MTNDPERFLRARGGLERELLASVQDAGPPQGAKDKAWSAIAAQLAGAAIISGAAAPSTVAAKAGLGSLLPGTLATKAALTLAVGGVAIGGYLAAQHAFQAPEASDTPVRPRAAVVASAPAAAPEAPATQTQVATLPSTEAAGPDPQPAQMSKHGAGSRRPDRLAAESRLLAAARAQLRAGDARGAKVTLQQLATQFPRGVLLQEREVLAIELLAAQGNAASAQHRARAFVSAHPESPHSAKLQRFLDAP